MISHAFSCVLLVSALVATAQAQVLSSQRAVFSVGDLHGDFDRFKIILEGLGLASFDSSGGATWKGGRSILVSTGDIADRGDHSRPIFYAFMSLARQAAASGGEVINILGNHDVFNLMGDLRYVSDSELDPSGDFGGSQARQHEFSAAGAIGRDIRNRYLAAVVRGGTLFVHAGLHPRWLRESGGSLEGMNNRIRALLNLPVIPDGEREPILGSEGPLWDRKFAEDDPIACQLVQETLRLVGAKRMTVGHTIFSKGVQTQCPSSNGPQIILGDTAISRAYGQSGKISAVEYRGDSVTAVYFEDLALEPPKRVPLFEQSPLSSQQSTQQVAAPLTLSERLLSLAHEVVSGVEGLLQPSTVSELKRREGWVQRPKPQRPHSTTVR